MGPMGPVEAGIEGAFEFEVDDALLTDVGGTIPSPVLSTPSLVMMMERSASLLVYPRLEPGKATVGFEVCIKHVAAATKGTRCIAHARLQEVVDGRKLRFAVEVVTADGRTLGVGTHERRIIDAQAP